MSDDVRRHAFEPYFSTRPKIAGGTTGRGLGLAIVWGIVHQAGGHVGFASTPGMGTFVRVYLPVGGS
jgi:signal transduction histidine kinase